MKYLENLKLEPIKDRVDIHLSETGGKWEKDKRYLQVIEEVGELALEIIENNQENKEEELGDILFTYLVYLDDYKDLTQEERNTVIKELWEFRKMNLQEKDEKELLLLFQSFLSLENKVFRKLEKRRAENRKIELNSELKIEINKYKSLTLLNLLRKKITGNTFDNILTKTLNKYNRR